MRFSSLLGPTTAEFASIIQLWPVFICSVLPANAINFDTVPSPNLDLSQLGRVALAGDFDAISIYTYQHQSEHGFSTNGSQSLLSQMPNGAFASLAAADASIQTMCPFVMKDGTLAGVVVGGNFTSLGGMEAQGVAMFDPNSTKITPLPGLSGQVSALLCDQDTNTVYVGGDFKGANSTNAIAWVGRTGWANFPFAGFNGPVTSIAKAPDGNIIFGGSFDGLGNTTTPSKKDQQVINLTSANITAGSSTSTAGFSNPSNIICKTHGRDGPTDTWLLADDKPGFWRADMGFGYVPTKLRIWNTHQDGRGTKTFRFTAIPIEGIMNFTYTDPSTGQLASCDARCPLSANTTEEYRDFQFVNVIGMSGFQIDISDWYGKGGGLDGIELFQDDIYAYAVDDFNEPACANVNLKSTSTVTGPWSVNPSGSSTSKYLSANLNGPTIDSGSASVVFKPDIKQSGNYSVTVYTPGCLQDNACSNRGIANITASFASGTRSSPPLHTEIYQTNNYDKYDQIYYGYVDANSDSFRPTVTLAPSSGQSRNLNIVAHRVRFQLISSTGGLNGLFEFNPNQATINTDFSSSTIDQTGMDLNTGATITSMLVHSGATYIGGNFSSPGFENIFSISDGNATSLANGGLNAQVTSIYSYGDLLFVGGNFSNASKPGPTGLNHVTAYSISKKAWQSLGAGVNGRVNAIVPLTVNLTQNQPETCITINGDFDQILATSSNKSISVHGFAIWVPSHNNWLQNLNIQTMSISGQLTTATNYTNSSSILAGTISSQGLSLSDVVSLSTSGPLGLNSLPVKIQPQQLQESSKRKRAVSGQNVTGAVTGYFYEAGDRNVTIVGGHFTATATNGSLINNLVFINGSKNDEVTGVGSGLDADSVFLTLTVQGDTLFAGGTISGTINEAQINGLILYDLLRANYAATQPPSFSGDNVAVNAIAPRPNTGEVYVGGNFDSAGSLSCPSVCLFQTSASQWIRPGTGLGGSVGALAWSGADTLIVGGNLTIGGNATSMATYDAKKQQWSALTGAASSVPGPVTALSPANSDASQFWVAGKSTNGSAFLMKYDGSRWHPIGDMLGKQTTIRGLQVLMLSKEHGSNDLIEKDQTLLLTGQLDLPSFGNASAALFNGTTISPFILSTTTGNAPGSLSQMFSQKRNFFKAGSGHMALGLVILISLIIALFLTAIVVAIGFLAERYRRRREGYSPAPSMNMYDKNSNVNRVPPEQLFGTLRQRHGPGQTPLI